MVEVKPEAMGPAQSTFQPRQHGPQSFLIWGGNGWIAGHLYSLLQSQGRTVATTTARMEDREGVMQELDRVKPTHVLNCAGVTGRPNVDWCEDNKQATIRSNVIGTLNLADCCFVLGIHITVFATGCMTCPFLLTVVPQDQPAYITTRTKQASTLTTASTPSAAKATSKTTPQISPAHSTLPRRLRRRKFVLLLFLFCFRPPTFSSSS